MTTATKKAMSAWSDGVWCTRMGGPDLQYRMIGKPSTDGWADFQCLSDLQRIREWNIKDMVPLNDAASAAMAKGWA
jgi:hypothetical protein